MSTKAVGLAYSNTYNRLYRKEEGKLSFTEHDKGWSYFMEQLAKHCEKTK